MQNTNFILEQPLPFNSKRLDTVANDGMIAEGRVVVTPKMARQILDTCNYDGQRAVSKSHVAKLAVQMRNGAWMAGSQIAFGRVGHNDVLVNGQHRLSAVIEYGAPVEFQFLVVPVADKNALHALYYSFDAVQRARSTEVILKSTGIADDLGISGRTARGAYVAGVIIALGFKPVAGVNRDAALGTPAGRLEAIRPWWPYVQQYDRILSSNTEARLRLKLQDGGCMAVALVTIKEQPAKAEAFWRNVAMNDGLHKGQPERTFVDALMNASFKGVERANTLVAASCWNAYYAGRTLKQVNMGGTKDCRIAGTSWAKGTA